jgi:two-component system, NarL family, response regulator DevR
MTGLAVGQDRADGRTITVMLVDDHQMFVESLASLLFRVPGLRVVAAATNGAEARAAVRARQPDVVLMDYELPDGRGTDLAAEIVAENPSTRVVMLTATDDGNVVAAAIAAGCSGYVTKDRAAEDVVTAVRLAHAGELVMPPPSLSQLRSQVGPDGSGGEEERISKRELEVLQLMAEGLTTAAMAARLFLSSHTVRNHVQHILAKLGAHSKLEAVSIAVRSGLLIYR